MSKRKRPRTTRKIASDEARQRAHPKIDTDAWIEFFRQGWENEGDAKCVLAAFQQCQAEGRPLPDWVRRAIPKVMGRGLPQPTINTKRWLEVRDLLDQGIRWRDVFKHAVTTLEGTDTAGTSDAIEKSYKQEERKLPPELRRQRKHDRWRK